MTYCKQFNRECSEESRLQDYQGKLIQMASKLDWLRFKHANTSLIAGMLESYIKELKSENKRLIRERDGAALEADRLNAKLDAIHNAIDSAVKGYRCKNHVYDDDQGGMELADVLTPDGDESILRGQEEIDALIDYICGEVSDAIGKAQS